MLIIAIDGACRRNGKPTCVSAGGIFVVRCEGRTILSTQALSNYELRSTSQRGELLALLTAIDQVWETKDTAQIITDSEYIFNTMTKDWCKNWERKGWVTASNEPVKNKDIWLEIIRARERCEADGYEIQFYHIKGHACSFGKATANNLLTVDETGRALYNAIRERVSSNTLDAAVVKYLDELSMKNNGFILDEAIRTRFITVNTVADAIATKCVEAADALM